MTGWTLDPDGKHLTWSDGCGIGRVRLLGTREIASFPLQQIKRVRLVRRADGYYAQFVVEAKRRVEHRPTGKQVGIDVGLNAYYTDSTGARVENPRYLRQSEQCMRMLNRRLSRKSIHHQRGRKPKHNHAARQRAKQNKYPRQTMSPVATTTQETSASVSAQVSSQRVRAPKPPKQSANWHKARVALARRHLTIQRQREDFARKQANALVSSHDLIALEDLQVRNLVKNRHLAKAISDASWATFRYWVEHYGQVRGIPVIAVPPRYTSQRCSRCGTLVMKSLSVRTHICPSCCLILDRDQNAASNILTAALNQGTRAAKQDYHRTVGHTET